MQTPDSRTGAYLQQGIPPFQSSHDAPPNRWSQDEPILAAAGGSPAQESRSWAEATGPEALRKRLPLSAPELSLRQLPTGRADTARRMASVGALLGGGSRKSFFPAGFLRVLACCRFTLARFRTLLTGHCVLAPVFIAPELLWPRPLFVMLGMS